MKRIFRSKKLAPETRTRAWAMLTDTRFLNQDSLAMIFKHSVFFVVVSFLIWNTPLVAFGKGCSGVYYIAGTAYHLNKSSLKNSVLTVLFGSDTIKIKTDENGYFEIGIPWETPCSSASHGREYRRTYKKMNPHYIVIHFGETIINLKNKWKKYASCHSTTKEKVTWKKDIVI